MKKKMEKCNVQSCEMNAEEKREEMKVMRRMNE